MDGGVATSGPGGPGRPRTEQPAAWVRRLFGQRGLCPDERRLFWYGQHLERFLRWCRKRGEPGPLEDLRVGYLGELEATVPPVPDWQMGQVRQALEAFVQGVDHWRWEPTAEGGVEPRFRLKTGAPAGARQGVPGFTNEPRSLEAVGVLRLLHPGDDWRLRMREVLRVRHYAWRTEQTYLEWTERFLRWRGGGEPSEAETVEVQRLLEGLAVEKNVSASTQNQAFSALLFFFEHVLGRRLGDLRGTLRARRGARLPVVLSRDEVRRLLAALEGTFGLMAGLMYGTGSTPMPYRRPSRRPCG